MTADRKTVEGLHGALAKAMQERLKSGEATAADLNVIRQFLKDNGVGLGLAPNAEELDKLREQLPFNDLAAMAEEDSVIN